MLDPISQPYKPPQPVTGTALLLVISVRGRVEGLGKLKTFDDFFSTSLYVVAYMAFIKY
jgi:hypothetical protein